MSVFRFAHLSDPHFGTIHPETERGLLARLRALKPDAVVFSGDITQRARKAQFLAAREFKEKLSPVPVHAVPGNHDIPLYNIFGRAFAPYHGFEKYFHPRRESATRFGHVELLALNSTKPWRHVQGSFSARDLAARIPPRDPGVSLRIVAFHHPMDCASSRDEKNLIRGREAMLPVLEEREVDLVLGGHIHDPHVALSDTRYPGGKRTFVLATAGTCLSWRTRLNAPNSFYWVEAAASAQASLKITRFELDKSKEFQPGFVMHFVRGERGNWDYKENA